MPSTDHPQICHLCVLDPCSTTETTTAHCKTEFLNEKPPAARFEGLIKYLVEFCTPTYNWPI